MYNIKVSVSAHTYIHIPIYTYIAHPLDPARYAPIPVEDTTYVLLLVYTNLHAYGACRVLTNSAPRTGKPDTEKRGGGGGGVGRAIIIIIQDMIIIIVEYICIYANTVAVQHCLRDTLPMRVLTDRIIHPSDIMLHIGTSTYREVLYNAYT